MCVCVCVCPHARVRVCVRVCAHACVRGEREGGFFYCLILLH